MSRTGTGVTQLQWIEAGQSVLRTQGISGVRIGALTKKLGVSSGSFYHHFKNMDAYHHALTEYYAKEQWQRILDQAGANNLGTPVERLKAIGRTSARTHFAKLAYAMRAWANISAQAAAAVQEFDLIGFGYLESQLREIGFAKTDAKVRAFLMIAAGSVEFDAGLTGLSEKTLRDVGFEILAKK